ncbi:MAG TPA: PqqD family protein [Allosphingosinicella sp.]|jgi:hypothetical protein
MTGDVLKRDPDVVAAEVDGEPRLLHLRSWTYLSLNPAAERIWALLAETDDEEALVACLLAEFDADEAEVRADVAEFLDRLHRQGFLLREER